MTLLEASILGLVEGITEYLPVSSTGHLILVSHLLGLDATEADKKAVDAFNIAIQGGAILAVIGVFWPRVRQMISGLLGRNPVGLRLAVNLFLSFLPAAIIGLLINDWVKEHLFRAVPVTAALFLGGVALVVLWRWQRHHYHEPASPEDSGPTYLDLDRISWRHALAIGLFQCVAIWPGTSRSMMTIIGGMLLGLRPRQAAEYSFLLGLPTLGAACAYESAKALAAGENGFFNTLGVSEVIVGVIVAALSAAIAVKWLLAYLNRHGLALFGWYRIGLGLVLIAMIASGQMGADFERGDTPPSAASSD